MVGDISKRILTAFSVLARMLTFSGTIGKSSEIIMSLNFTAEHAENAEASETPARIGTVLKLCALRGDKSLDF